MPEHRNRYMSQVMHGTIEKTPGGLTKKDIKTVVKNGVKHYVSKAKSENAKNILGEWNKAVSKAKKNLNIGKHEFVLLDKNGELYKEASKLYKSKKKSKK
jgi:hypothetical protein